MTRRLVVTYVVLTAFALALLALPLGVTFARHERDGFLSEMEADADTIASLAAYPIESGQPVPARDMYQYALRNHAHVIVVNARGRALLDTQYSGPGRDYSNRPEIDQALAGQRVEGRRRSDTAGTTLLYAAVPTNAKGRVNGAVRITYPTGVLDARVRRVWMAIIFLCLGVLALAALAGVMLARSIARPVRRLEDATDRFAAGDLTARVDTGRGPPELRQFAATFNRMTERHARLLDAQQRFASDASHQLRTPLTALRLRLENLDAFVAERDRPAIEAATAEVARLSRLIDGLLLLALDESDKAPRAPVDVARVVRERADVWSVVTGERDVALTVDAPATAWVLAAPDLVEQLVDNLVDNAFTASPDSGRIELRVDTTANEVALHVLDEGPGLDADARLRAFDRFWRAPDAPAGGSGLGLAIVRQLAEAQGGEARLEGRRGRGLDAIVILPATPAPPESASHGAEGALTWR